METLVQTSTPNRKRAVIKGALLAAFIVAAIILVRFTSIKDFLTKEAPGNFLGAIGFWAPLAFMLIYAAGICLFIPGTLLTAFGAAIFGAYWGFLYVWMGAKAGATAAFWIGRTLGREFAASLVGNRLRKYDDATVFYLRLVYFPFTAMNFGMGLTKVRFRDYFLGTCLGILAGTFIFTFFVGTLKEVWAGGNWGNLISFKVFFSVGLFVFSLFISRILKKLKNEK
jgi:uncharacterized membrane protein YdjX (TVP38/TMEM64 family)